MNKETSKCIVIGIGELAATSSEGFAIKTYALGSCVALIFLDPETHMAGMAHVALPDSKICPEEALRMPGRFADTAIPALLKEMTHLGCKECGKTLMVKLVGGAQVADPNEVFNIGKRNVLALKKLLWERGMGAIAEDVGGTKSRTVTVEVDTGLVHISSPGEEILVI